MRFREVEPVRPGVGLGGGDGIAQRHGDALRSGEEIADRAAQWVMQALRGIGVNALVAAFERAVIRGADHRLLRHFLL